MYWIPGPENPADGFLEENDMAPSLRRTQSGSWRPGTLRPQRAATFAETKSAWHIFNLNCRRVLSHSRIHPARMRSRPNRFFLAGFRFALETSPSGNFDPAALVQRVVEMLRASAPEGIRMQRNLRISDQRSAIHSANRINLDDSETSIRRCNTS